MHTYFEKYYRLAAHLSQATCQHAKESLLVFLVFVFGSSSSALLCAELEGGRNLHQENKGREKFTCADMAADVLFEVGRHKGLKVMVIFATFLGPLYLCCQLFHRLDRWPCLRTELIKNSMPHWACIGQKNTNEPLQGTGSSNRPFLNLFPGRLSLFLPSPLFPCTLGSQLLVLHLHSDKIRE